MISVRVHRIVRFIFILFVYTVGEVVALKGLKAVINLSSNPGNAAWLGPTGQSVYASTFKSSIITFHIDLDSPYFALF